METVEAATAATPTADVLEDAEEALQAPPDETPTEEAAPAGPALAQAAPADAWSGLIQAGMALLQQMAAPRNGSSSLLRRDEQTGETYLRLPAPPPEVLEQALRAVGSLLEGLRK
jgi:hypothetical protein